MTTDTHTIHVAHAISRKGGTHYRARAYACHDIGAGPMRHTFRIAIDDSHVSAERQVIQYVKDAYRAEGQTPPHRVINHGRLPAAIVDNHLFGKDV